MVSMDHSFTLVRVCEALENGDVPAAGNILAKEYPFVPRKPSRKQFSHQDRLRIFLRDGFIDRYSGERLLFHPVFAIIHHHLPEQFPSHSNWKMSVSHIAYWQLLPMVDHVQPAALGGSNDDDNLVTTSGVNNAIKAQYTLEDLRWELHPSGDLDDWDGLMRWAVSYCENNPHLLEAHHPAGIIRPWHVAALNSASPCGSPKSPTSPAAGFGGGGNVCRTPTSGLLRSGQLPQDPRHLLFVCRPT